MSLKKRETPKYRFKLRVGFQRNFENADLEFWFHAAIVVGVIVLAILAGVPK